VHDILLLQDDRQQYVISTQGYISEHNYSAAQRTASIMVMSRELHAVLTFSET